MNAAELIMRRNSAQTRDSSEEIGAIEHMLTDNVFYTPVPDAKRQTVIQVTSREFSDTGHLTQLAECLEFVAPVGGQNYTVVAGVEEHAVNMERLVRETDHMGL